MTRYLRAYCQRADGDGGGDDPSAPIRFVASTEGIARDGLVIDADGWELEAYRANPVILWSHDYFGNRPPIGRADKVWVEDGKLMADVVFDPDDEFARSIRKKYLGNFLSAVSVGWDTRQVEPPTAAEGVARITKAELLDISAVPVPGDPNALMERQKRALAAVVVDLARAVEGEPSANFDPATPTEPTDDSTAARASWDETAAAMARLYRPYLQGPDGERRAEHARLARAYGRHGKTPPEFVGAAALESLGPGELRGLFLEGEPELLPDLFAAMEVRAGKVLSARNRSRLEQARDAIDEVLRTAEKEAEAAAGDDEERATLAALQALSDKLAGVTA